MHFDTDQLREYRFGLLDEQETARIAAHLETCSDCRAELEAVGRQFALLDLLKEQPVVSENLVTSVLHQRRRRFSVASSRMASRQLRRAPSASTTKQDASSTFKRPAFVIFAAAASIAIIFGIFQRGNRSPSRSNTKIADSSVYSVSSVVNPPQPTLAELRAEKPFAPASNIELNVLPRRDDVQLTIYNEEDLTLVREKRKLTLKRGWNWLQFMWSNTLIDPTSLALEPKTHADQIEITQLVYPPRLNELARWTIFSEFDGEADFELTYFTSGLKWNAFYEATLAPDEQEMKLKAYVRVDNGSGEDYENAETRLVVGQINLEEKIAELARRQYAYGSPVNNEWLDSSHVVYDNGGDKNEEAWSYLDGDALFGSMDGYLEQKEILKQALSEYQLYTIEGRETIPDGWGKRLPSFDVQEIGVTNLYKYDEQRWGNSTMRFLSFANTEACKLGEDPLPNGTVRVFRNVDEASSFVMPQQQPNVHNEAGSFVYNLSYVGATDIKYIPVGEVVELELGAAQKVTVEPKLMRTRTENYEFYTSDNQPDSNELNIFAPSPRKGDISGWDEITDWKLEITNTRDLPVEIEITRSTNSTDWEISTDTPYEKYDATRVRFTVRLEPRSKKEINYELTVHHGTRSDG
ncbi:MAG: DUF4139 domain-containing protein [Lentisphaerae bacterium]|mgnify:CR=1 FL=1|nr:DUF4139 domain-containing protein [Lentisphaerota bacterium]